MRNRRLGSTPLRFGVEVQHMFSWIFRHRAKLRLIYGPPPVARPLSEFENVLETADSRPEAREPDSREAAARSASKRQPAGKGPRKPVARKARRRGHPDAGRIERRGSFVLIGPMPKRRA